jgi:hypothetical protein
VAGQSATRFLLRGFEMRKWIFAVCGLACLIAAYVPAFASATAPQVNQTWVEDVTTSRAGLHARLDSGGVAGSYRFDYIADADYLANEAAGVEVFSGAARLRGGVGKGGDEPVSATAVPLLGETTYRYRVVVENADGAVAGPERVLTTKGAGSTALLDARGWEMVSPVDKNGGEVQGPGADAGGGVFQAASQGGAVTFSSGSSFGADAGGAPAGSQYVSQRGPEGWTVENVTAPLAAGGYGDQPAGVPYRLFSSDLSLGLLAAPQRPPLPGSDAPAGYANYYWRDAGGYAALLGYADIAGLAVSPQSFELHFAGASPDLSQVVLSSCAALTGNATEVPGPGEGCDPNAPNLYLRSAAGWRLLNVLPGETAGVPPASLAARSGAISSDGSRVYWTDGANLYLSRAGAGTVQVDGAVGGGGTFQAAAADGSVAYFTSSGSLYRYDAGPGTTTDLTPGEGVVGVLGVSTNGSAVYFATATGIFLNRGGTANTAVAAATDPSNFPPSTGTARVSDDGGSLAFVSTAELTPYDNTDTSTGEPASEVYLYDAGAGTLICVSCNPTGERPRGPSTLPGAVANGAGEDATRAYKPRVLSADGRRLFFDSPDALVSGDTNGTQQDVYEWEAGGSGSCGRAGGGCLRLISAGSSHPSSFVDASASGGDAFFLTDNSLVKSDPGSVDLYDAREGGGFPQPEPPFVCEEDGCQPLPSPPDDPTPGTLVPTGGNPPVHFPKAQGGKPKRQKHRPHGGRRHGRQRGGHGARR